MRGNLAAFLLPTLVAAVVFLLYFQAQPHWLADPDAQDYAQLGRQLAAGRGPTTRYMPWNGLDFLTDRGEPDLTPGAGGEAAPSWPNIGRFPLTPFLMALGFAALGPSDETVHLPAGLAFILTAGCAGLLGARVYGVWAGLTAGLTAAVLPLFVNYSLTGLTEPLLGLLILGVLACLVQSSPTPNPSPVRGGGGDKGAMSCAPTGLSSVGAQFIAPTGGEGTLGPGSTGYLILGGVLFGLAVLNRYDTLLLALPILALWLLPRTDRVRASGLFLGAALLVVLPWAAYLTAVAGTPLFNLQPASIAAQASGRADGLGWYLPEYVSPAEVWARDPSRALRTAWRELAATPDHLRKLVGWPWLVAGGLACLLALSRVALTPRPPLPSEGEGESSRESRAGSPLPRTGTSAQVLSDVAPQSDIRTPQELASRRMFAPRSGGAGGENRRLLVLLLVAVLLRAALASALGLNLQRHFVPLVPLLVVVVAGEAHWLVGRLPIRRLHVPVHAAVALLLVVPGLWTIWPFLVPPSQPPGPPTRTGEVEARPDNLARLAELVGPGQVIASNVPWSVAWQADRRAVPLPPTVESTADLERRFGVSIDAIYVAGQVAIADAPRSWRAWDELRRRGTPPPGYVLADSFANGGRLFVKAR